MRNQKGFSLIEILVAIVIAGIVLSGVLGSYFSLLQASQRSDIARQLQKEMNFAVIRMADKIRSYSIDYKAYEDENVDVRQSQSLFTKSSESDSFHRFQREDFSTNQRSFSTLGMDGAPLFSSIFEVEEMNFSVTPNADPANPENLGDKSVQLQPKATLFLRVRSFRYPDISFTLQTTISSRRYE